MSSGFWQNVGDESEVIHIDNRTAVKPHMTLFVRQLADLEPRARNIAQQSAELSTLIVQQERVMNELEQVNSLVDYIMDKTMLKQATRCINCF
jgi:hypothetical protein